MLEYRTAYPDKAVVYYAQKYPELAWAVFMAGGSCPAIARTDKAFLQSAATIEPTAHHDGCYVMQDARGDAMVWLDTVFMWPRSRCRQHSITPCTWSMSRRASLVSLRWGG